MKIDSNLKWDDHINAFIPKISSKIGILRSLRRIVPIETLKLLYNAIVQPHFDYSDIVYDSTSKTNKDRLQKLQTSACRLITGSGPCTSHIPMFHEQHCFFLQYRCDFHKLLWCINAEMAWPPNTYVTHSMQIMPSITTTLQVPHWELLNMPKQELHIIMIPLHFLVKGYEIIFQIILNFAHLYLVLKMLCTSIWLLSHSFKRYFSW